jgi:probable phosphoglycerate mutase
MELPRWREALARGGVNFRILLADQKLVEYRLRSRDPVSSLLMQNVSDLRKFLASLDPTGSRIEVRFYSVLPFGPLYVVDHKIFWGIYLSHKDSMDGPVFHEPDDSHLGQELIKSFERAWEEASERTGMLSIASPVDGTHVDHNREEVDIQRRISIVSKKLARIDRPGASDHDRLGGYLCVLRHADTDLNEADIITGDLDVGINASGRAHLRKFGAAFEREKWEAVYSAPARRCTETLIELLQDESGILLRDEFRGREMGVLEGFSKTGYHESLPQYAGQDLLKSFHASSQDGESYCDVFRRVAPFLEILVDQVIEGKRILICTHDTVIRMIALLLDGISIGDSPILEVANAEPLYYAPASAAQPPRSNETSEPLDVGIE